MAKVEVYSKGYCPFCMATKRTLKKLNVEFQEFDISTDPKKTKEMIERSQRRTVPQVFVNNQHIGGNDDLQIALGNGKLLALLNSK